MAAPTLTAGRRALRRRVGKHYRRHWIAKSLPPFPSEAVVPVEQTTDVILLCSRLDPDVNIEVHIKELALALELASRGRSFAVSTEPSRLFGKSIAWFLPGLGLVKPRLWDYSRQVTEFAEGLERQGNRLFCSAAETRFWENKAYMHRAFAEHAIPTPETRIVTADGERPAPLDGLEPVLVKEEHSSGSSGIHHFQTAAAASAFVEAHAFKPAESLLVQAVVPGATRDLRLTMVGGEAIAEASYWRTKSEAALRAPVWTTTATSQNSLVEHGGIPPSAVALAAEWLERLGLRTAGLDLMWPHDDLDAGPLLLELSPYYQPNPPKPERYRMWTYKQFKSKPYIEDGYFAEQCKALRSISARILDEGFF
jgi:hypothetical protein